MTIVRPKTRSASRHQRGELSAVAPEADQASGRLYGGESPEGRVQRRREQFLDAGLELIGSQGYRAASVRALCRQAKLTDRYFYESFDTVEDVLIGVYERENQRMAAAVFQTIPDIKPGMSVGEVARPALRMFFETARKPYVARIIWFEVQGVSDRVNRIYRDTISDYGQMLLTIVRSLYPIRQLPPHQEPMLAMAIVGAISQVTMGWILSDYQATVDDLVEVTMMILEGLVMRMNPTT